MLKLLCVGGIAAGFSCAAVVALDAIDPQPDIVVAGSVIVDTAVTAVQHPTGGIVAEIRRRNGDHVKSGELLARLDDSIIRNNLVHSTSSVDLLVARKARLEAERDGKSEIAFPPGLADRPADTFVHGVMDRERRLFVSRNIAKESESELQRIRMDLLQDEIAGLKVQEQSKAAEMSLITRELDGVRALRDKNLMPIGRLTALDRDAVRLESERNGSLPVGIAQAKSRIADTRLQIIRAERDALRDISNELRDTDEKLSDLLRRKVDFEEQLRQQQILSPQDGIVLSSAISAAGCPVAPGTNIMLIAPSTDKPSIEARVDLPHAARLRIGQAAKLIVASQANAASEFPGRLRQISPSAADANAAEPGYATLRFELAPEVQATLATMPPGTSVKISISGAGERRSFMDLMTSVRRPLRSIEQALL